MLVFGNPDFWEEDQGVWQMLVFSSEIAQRHFEQRYNSEDNPRTNSGFPTDTGIGALYKLRAIRSYNGRWNFLIRCGMTAMILNEVRVQAENKEAAMFLAVTHLSALMNVNLSEKIKTMQMLHMRNLSMEEEHGREE